MRIGIKKIVDLYYTALMTTLVFTFADHLLQGIVQYYCKDLLLYILMWLSLVIQTTFAYVHIIKVPNKNYTTKAFLWGSVDIGVALYVCASIGSTCKSNEYIELSSYLHLSIPFLILSCSQLIWFITVKEFNVSAIFRISILFLGMLAVTISECVNHSFWNLVAIVVLIVLLGILRVLDTSPRFFANVVTKIWEKIKVKYIKKGFHAQLKEEHDTDVSKPIEQ